MRIRTKRILPIALGVLIIAAAVTLAVQLRRRAPPEPARLLPGADAFFYVNLAWVRTLNAVSQLPPVSRDPEYEQFVQQTGFQFERDLDKAAFAVHYPASWGGGGTGDSSPQPRCSELCVGRIQNERRQPYRRGTGRATRTCHSPEVL